MKRKRLNMIEQFLLAFLKDAAEDKSTRYLAKRFGVSQEVIKRSLKNIRKAGHSVQF